MEWNVRRCGRVPGGSMRADPYALPVCPRRQACHARATASPACCGRSSDQVLFGFEAFAPRNRSLNGTDSSGTVGTMDVGEPAVLCANAASLLHPCLSRSLRSYRATVGLLALALADQFFFFCTNFRCTSYTYPALFLLN